MPTAVGPNTKGEENLVFGYDLGDVANSYKGEPTSLFGESFPTGTELPSGFHWGYEYDHQIVDAPISNHFLSNKKWIKSTRDTTGSRRVLFINNSFIAGRTYTFSCYAYSTDTRLTSLSHVSHNGGYSSTQNVTSYTSADIGTVKRIHGTWIQQVNGGPIFGMQTNDAALGTTFYITGLQVEEKTRATQLTGGSRSATQGLLDLTGNRTIDLTNVNFDSNANMVFDGTDDEFSIGTDLGFQNASFSLEAVINWDGGSTDTFFGYRVNPDTTQQSIHWRIYNNGQLRFDFYSNSIDSAGGAIVANEWTHLIVTYDYGSDTCTCYKNGTLLMQGNVGPYLGSDTASTGYIGSWGPNNQHFGGEIPAFKIYNRALTASEVQSNFNAIKGRFNI